MKNIIIVGAVIAGLCASADIMSSNNTCGSIKFTLATHNAAKYIPPDIRALPDSSLIKQKYDKIFHIIPNPIRNWADKKYEDRRRFLESPHWQKAKSSLKDKISRMGGKLEKEPAVTEEEVMKLAEEIVTYGRGLVSGAWPQVPGFEELADAYGFKNVAKYLKKALQFDRYRHRGMEETYPETPEFADFETLALVINPDEWKEVRGKWKALNEKFEENVQAGTAVRKNAKK